MTEIIETTKDWTPKMVKWLCFTAIRGMPEYEWGWRFGTALGEDVDKALRIELLSWARNHEWGDPATNYDSMTMLINETIEHWKAWGIGKYRLATVLGLWEGYSRFLRRNNRANETRPVPDILVEEMVNILREEAKMEER
jgi:hypothetical protein